MQSIAVFVAVLAVASASTVYRVPSADSAIINSQRVGGNFAYSTSESAAYGVVSPVVQNVATPVATTYTVQQPAVLTQGVQNVLPATYGYNYAYGASVPVAYTAVQGNTVQVDQTKQVAEVRVAQPVVQQVQPVQVQQIQPVVQQVQQVQPIVQQQVQQVQQVQEVKQVAPVATTYSVQVQQPLVQVQQVQPVVQQVQQVQEVKQVAPVATTYSVQQPTWVQQQGSVVASGWPVATTYSVQAPTSVVQAGTPASTYKPLNGVSPLGVNTYAYGYGYGLPYNTVNVNTVV